LIGRTSQTDVFPSFSTDADINRKRVQRLMRVLGLAGMAPGPATGRPHPEHKIYPYLLRGVDIVRPNQVWSSDITYIRLEHGFAYLVAVVDWNSRRVLSWRLSNTLEAEFCVDCLEEALRGHGKPAIFNTDQGARGRSSPARPSPGSCWRPGSPSAWMVGAERWTTSSSSACGEA
jgi:transposase InsO family protein